MVMNIYNLKNKTNKYILSRENLNEDEKIQLINFVEEASEHQVMNLLITGRMCEDSKVPELIEEQYNEHNVEKKLNEIALTTTATIVAMLAFIGAAAVIMGASQLFMLAVSKSYRACNKYNETTPDFWLCTEKIKLDAYEKKLKYLKSNISLCGKAKDPKKCNSKVRKAISKTESNIKKAKSEITTWEKKVKASKHGKY